MFGQGQCSAVAPDEITYAAIFRDIFLGVPNTGLGEVYGSSRYIYYIYYFPGFLFNLAFENSIYAIRFSSIVFSLIIFLIAERIILNVRPSNSLWISRFFKLSFLFLPSIFIFTSSGIRESLLLFSLVLTFYGLKSIIQNNLRLGITIFTIGLLFSTSAKIYLFPILALSTLIVVMLIKANRLRNVCIVFAASIISLIMFWQPIAHVFLNVEYQRPSNSVVANDSIGNNSENSLVKPNGILKSELPSATSLWLNYCLEQRTLGFLKEPIKILFWDKDSTPFSDKSKVEAGQPVEVGESPVAILYKYYEFRRILPVEQVPFNILKFLTNPILDLKSKYLLLFLIELPFWILSIFVLCLSFLGVRRLRFDWNWLTLYSGLIFIMYLVFSGATEVNVGTSIRHRIYLWLPLMFLLSGIRREPTLGPSKQSGKNLE
jgi:hypothetical protein